MSFTRSPKQQKTSKKAQRSPSPNEDVIQRKLRSTRLKSRVKEAEPVPSTADTNEAPNHDIETVDDGLDEPKDGDDDTSSVSSGPSHSNNQLSVRLSSPQALCSTCGKLHQKAKRSKAPVINKLLDNDPTSPTCDQWVLLKKWRPSRQYKANGKLNFHINQIKKGRRRQSGQCAGERESSSCSRPHAFLQRNRRQHVRVLPTQGRKRKARRKRPREDEQGPCVAKQQRLDSSSLTHQYQQDSTDESSLYSASVLCGSPNFKGGSQEMDDQPGTSGEVLPKQEAPQRTEAGFSDLLNQLRGNRSRIVKETH
ncbi:uncharacterized protein LOC143009978 isoform X2 [Genypterus blacodes]